MLLLVLHARPSRSFRQVLLISALAGFGSAIGIHFVIGYTNMKHLAPAFAGAAIFFPGWWLTRDPSKRTAALRRTAVANLVKV
jgi:acyl dehydratase